MPRPEAWLHMSRLSLGSKLQLVGFAWSVQSRQPSVTTLPPVATAPTNERRAFVCKYPKNLGRKELLSHVTAQERMWRRGKLCTCHFGPSAEAYEGGTTAPAVHKRMLSIVKCAAPEVLASELESGIPNSKLCAPCQSRLFSSDRGLWPGSTNVFVSLLHIADRFYFL